jgi:hypothetical protein
MATLIALVPFAEVIVDHSKLGSLPTQRAMEALVPSCKLLGWETLFLSPIGLDEIGQGKPLLVLFLFWGTRCSSNSSLVLPWRLVGLPSGGLAELCC